MLEQPRPVNEKDLCPVAEAVREPFLPRRVMNIQCPELIRDVTMHEGPKSDQRNAGVGMAKTIGAVEGALDFLPLKVESRIFVERKKAIEPMFSVGVDSPSEIKQEGFALAELVSIHGAPDAFAVLSGRSPIPRPDPQAAYP